MAMQETTGTGSTESDQGESGVKEAVGQAVGQAKQAAAPVVGQAQEQVANRVDSQKDRVAETLTTVAQAVRQTSDELRSQHQQTVARYADRAADATERAAEYLRQRDTGQLVEQVEWWARRNPSMFLAGGFILGLLAARFLRSSAPSQAGGGAYGGRSPYRAHPDATQRSGLQDDAPLYGPSGPVASPRITPPAAAASTAPTPAPSSAGVHADSADDRPQGGSSTPTGA